MLNGNELVLEHAVKKLGGLNNVLNLNWSLWAHKIRMIEPSMCDDAFKLEMNADLVSIIA